MRVRFRTWVVALLSLSLAIACVGGDNQCLNPQPDLPSCNAKGAPGGGGSPSVAGAGTIDVPSAGGRFAAAGAFGSGGSATNGDGSAGAPPEAAAGSSDSAGVGGEGPIEPDAGAGGVSTN